MGSPYATPTDVTSVDDCSFYHTMEIPGHGVLKGEWDLRGMERTYLGNVDFRQKRVLEVGPGSGFFSFYMEREGAEVVSIELSEDQPPDIVPYVSKEFDRQSIISGVKDEFRKHGNAFWFAHRAFNSKVRVVYGSVYEIPSTIGPANIATFGNVLLHLRDPFLALQRVLQLTTDTVIVTDIIPDQFVTPLPRFLRRFKFLEDMAGRGQWPLKLYNLVAKESMLFLPRYSKLNPGGTWWGLSPRIIKEFVGVLGFRQTAVSYHAQRWGDTALIPHFTVVGHRTDNA